MSSDSGSSPGYAPRPISVIVTGMPVLRTSSRSSCAGVAADDAAAGVDHRPLGALDRRRHLRDLLGLGLALFDVIARQVHRRVVVGHDLRLLHVLRHVDQHRARPARRGDVKRLAHDAGHVVDVGHQIMVLGDAAADFDDRRFLKGIGADHGGPDLAGDGDQRNAVQLGVGDGT